MQPSTDIATSVSRAEVLPPDLLTPLLRAFTEQGVTFADITPVAIFGVLVAAWNVFALLAYVAAALLMYAFVYATLRASHYGGLIEEEVALQERLYRERHGGVSRNSRWQELQGHVESENPNDWRLAIIEADIMLDDALKQAGYAGTTLGERLRSVSPRQLASIDDAWQAHKVRNQIAHAGADFILTKKLARETVNQYQRVFEELGVL